MNKLADWMRHLSRSKPLPTDPLGRRRFLSQSIWTAAALGIGAGATRTGYAQAPAPVSYTHLTLPTSDLV